MELLAALLLDRTNVEKLLNIPVHLFSFAPNEGV